MDRRAFCQTAGSLGASSVLAPLSAEAASGFDRKPLDQHLDRLETFGMSGGAIICEGGRRSEEHTSELQSH